MSGIHSFLFVFLFVFLFLSNRVDAFLTIKTIKEDTKSVIIKLSESDEVSIGDSLEYKDPNGNSCIVKVTKLNNNMLALAEASLCDDFSILKPGKMFEPINGDEVAPDNAPESERGARGERASRRRERTGHSSRGAFAGTKLGVRLYYSLASEFYSSTKASGSTLNFIDKTTGAGGLGLNLSFITDSSLMFGFGGYYELERKLEYRQFAGGSQSKYTDGEGAALVILDLNLGFIFKKIVMAYLGVNMPSVLLSNMPEAKVVGNIGYHVSFTYLATSNLNFDLMFRYLNLSLTESDVKYDLTQFDGASVGFGYWF
jgi:hypothetical protein